MILRKALILCCGILLFQVFTSFTPISTTKASRWNGLIFKTMYISKNDLLRLSNDPNFDKLYFSSFYDKRHFPLKDVVKLLAYIKSTNTSEMQLLALGDTTYKKEKTFKDRSYATYILSKQIIQNSIITPSEKIGSVEYFLFEPVAVNDNPSYVAYDIYPAGNNKKELASVNNHTNRKKEEAIAGNIHGPSSKPDLAEEGFVPVNNITRLTPAPLYTLNPCPKFCN